jgi:hypothetical protein
MSADMIERLAHECATEASIARLMEVPLGLIILSMDAATARTHISQINRDLQKLGRPFYPIAKMVLMVENYGE